MASEASWQTGSAEPAGQGNASPASGPMDQQTVEALLRRLLTRVEESERRYGEALEELHARLDQLSQTTDAARAEDSPDEAATLGRLRSQVSGLARRLEQTQEIDPALDEFLELGKALAGKNFSPATEANWSAAPEPFANQDRTPQGAASFPQFEMGARDHAPAAAQPWLQPDEVDLDQQLVEIAHRLEHSIGAAVPSTELASLNARMDEIAAKFDAALSQSPKLEHLHDIERQLSDMGQKLGRAEVQIARIAGIEGHLTRLIDRFDEAPAQLEQVASHAANEAARLVSGEDKGKASAAERLDAIHRDLVAMNDRSRATDDRLADTLAAVHQSLKQLVQQVERGREPQAIVPPRAPVPERPLPAPAEASREKAPVRKESGRQDPSTRRSLRSRLGTAIPDFQEGEAPPSFGRAKRGQLGDEAVDLDLAEPPAQIRDAEYEIETKDDFVAAARRAAQAAAAHAEERSGTGSRRVRTSPSVSLASQAEPQGRRKRSMLMIVAALMLLTSAALLYGRLRSKPEPEASPPPIEESAPAPTASAPSMAPQPMSPSPAAPPAIHGTMPASPGSATPPTRSGESDIPPPVRVSEAPDDTEFTDAPSTSVGGVTEVAKSPPHPAPAPASEISPSPQPVSLKPDNAAVLLPGVSLVVQEPSADAKMPAPQTTGSTETMPSNLPMPPAETGPQALRQAAANGDAKAQYVIALCFAEGQGVPQNWTEAARWLGFAAASGLAPAQYRLAVLYERGQGISKDTGKARSWYLRAAEQGNIKAMHNLGVAEGDAADGKPDYAAAAKWYAEAASYGLADSQFNLAVLEEHGLGVQKNLPEAYKWFSLAAANGDAEAAKRRDLVKLELPAPALNDAEQGLKVWKAKVTNPEANESAVPAGADAASSNKALITRAQALLKKLGYDIGTPDGEMGDRTRDAIKSFERRNGMAETGEVTVPLVTKLERLTG
ncbi:MAG: peptidoglycan-binding protein [Methyloceanibacter sp.]